jgi:uncharacterized RDD family membrane protein YckC
VTVYSTGDATTPEVVTGEAVALDLRLARAGSRALAFGIDAIAVGALLLLSTLIIGHFVTFNDAAAAAAVALTMIVVILVGYSTLWETLTRGRSLGKLALGLRVVRDDGGPTRFRQAFVRGLCGMFELYLLFGSVALIASLLSHRGKRVGDVLAGTVVLQERVPSRDRVPIFMPPPLAGWAATADLSRVSDSLALSARQYLNRARELTPAAGAQMEAQLAGSVAAVIAPPPPPGTPGWALLAAVIAERRRRDEQRLGVGMPPPPPTPTAEPAEPPEPLPATPPDGGETSGGFAPPA